MRALLLTLALAGCATSPDGPEGWPVDAALWRPVWAATVACLVLPADTLEPAAVLANTRAWVVAHVTGHDPRTSGLYFFGPRVVVMAEDVVDVGLPHEFVHAGLHAAGVLPNAANRAHAHPGFTTCG